MAYAFGMTRGKYIWLVPLSLAVLVAVAGWRADRVLRQTINRELSDNLSTTLDANVTALEIWINNQKRMAVSLAEEPRLREAALTILDQAAVSATNRVMLNEISRELLTSEHLQERVRSLGYGMVHLVNTNLMVISEAGRRRGRQGMKVPEELQPKYHELFKTGEAIIVTPFKVTPPRGPGGRRFGPRQNNPVEGERPPRFAEGPPPEPGQEPGPRSFDRSSPGQPPQRDLTVMQVAAPIKNAAGETLGALGLIIDPNAEFTRILSVARSGNSGETFAFDAAGTLISESRFDEQLRQLRLIPDETNSVSALTLSLRDPGGDLTRGFVTDTNAQPLIYMVDQAVEGGSGVAINPFRDYRGVPVVGAWRWLPKYGFGVGTKIDAREAFDSLRVVHRLFLALIILLVAASLIVLIFTYRQVIWRKRLTEAELKARRLGQYQLVEKIGEGGMGIVYRAHHSLLRRDTALKLLPPDRTDAVSLERFEREVQLTCRLTHPNTIQVYDYGHTPDGIFYYAMEYLDGLNLHDLVERYGALPASRVAYILKQVCDSLAEAHGLGLIHRDVKPANVFISDRGGVPDSVKVLDFGLVKHLTATSGTALVPEIAAENGVVGTPNFVAPETIRDPNNCDARSDIYSVGVLGYYLVTGREIFDGNTISELCRKHLEEQPLRPSQRLGRAVDAGLETVLMQCLEKDPARRPASAHELAKMLATCGVFGNWTPEQRNAWWIGHRKSVSGIKKVPLVESSHVEKTVKIEFADRTP